MARPSNCPQRPLGRAPAVFNNQVNHQHCLLFGPRRRYFSRFTQDTVLSKLALDPVLMALTLQVRLRLLMSFACCKMLTHSRAFIHPGPRIPLWQHPHTSPRPLARV